MRWPSSRAARATPSSTSASNCTSAIRTWISTTHSTSIYYAGSSVLRRAPDGDRGAHAVVRHPHGRDEARIFLNEVLPAAPDIPGQIAHLTGAGGYDDSTDQRWVFSSRRSRTTIRACDISILTSRPSLVSTSPPPAPS